MSTRLNNAMKAADVATAAAAAAAAAPSSVVLLLPRHMTSRPLLAMSNHRQLLPTAL